MVKTELIFSTFEDLREYLEQFSEDERYKIAEENTIIIECSNKFNWILVRKEE